MTVLPKLVQVLFRLKTIAARAGGDLFSRKAVLETTCLTTAGA